jgi:putative transposase
MPRHARLRLAGHPCHVIQRGVNRSICFVDDHDRRVYLSLLRGQASGNDCAVHAYVLMTNHVHLLVTPRGEAGISNMMKGIGERYVPYFNRKHGRTGTLWEGRFRSNIVQSEGYLFSCYRYIELNPVRAGMVAAPGDYPWSSYAANASTASSHLVTPHDLYLRLGASPEERVAAYLRLFGAPTDDEIRRIREAANGGFALSDARFARQLQEHTTVPVARRKRGRPKKSPNENGAEMFRPAGKSGLSLF